jgi:DDE family transposase
MKNTDLLIEIFCDIDDFCKEFEPQWKKKLLGGKRNRLGHLTLSEIMTIVIFFHLMHFRTFKDYYTLYASSELRIFFPNLLSYSRFVRVMKLCLFPIFVFSQGCLARCTGIGFIDSTILTVCHIKRIHSHRVFHRIAKRGKTTTGWFFGFKLHLIINHRGEILAYMLTPGNTDDRAPVPTLCARLFGKLFGDRGYISTRLFQELYEKGIQIITKLRANMKNRLIPMLDKILLLKRGLIESVHNKLKNCCQIEHHRHRSPWNFLVNLIGGLLAYTYDRKKPALGIEIESINFLFESA